MSHMTFIGPSPDRYRLTQVTTVQMSSETIDLENARIADTQYLVRRSMTKGYQLLSIITPPIYIGFNLFRKRSSQITVNRVLRATWLGGVAGMYPTTGRPNIRIYISQFYAYRYWWRGSC